MFQVPGWDLLQIIPNLHPNQCNRDFICDHYWVQSEISVVQYPLKSILQRIIIPGITENDKEDGGFRL